MPSFTLPISQSVSLPDGARAVLVDRLGKSGVQPHEAARNVYLLDRDGRVVWQVHSSFDDEGNPFTSLQWDNAKLKAYRWDGGVYDLDPTTGEAKPVTLAR